MVLSFAGGTRSLVRLTALCALALGALQQGLVQASDSTPDVACQLAVADTSAPSSSAGPAGSTSLTSSDTKDSTSTTASAFDDTSAPSQASTSSSATTPEESGSAASASTFAVCRSSVSEGNRGAGIQVITDQACATTGGTGCFDSVCRYCQVAPTAQSTQYNKCSDYGYFIAYTAATASTSVSAAASNCTATITETDAAVGIWLVSDLTCASGGTGCSGTTCRFCQTRSTLESQGLLKCSDFGYTTSTAVSTVSTSGSSRSESSGTGTDTNADGSDGDFFWPEPPTGSFFDGSSSDPFGQTDALASCTMTVASGDAAVGLQIVTDSSCANGGLGCISTLCRFCKYFETAQSTVYVTCTSLGYYFATPTPATTTVTPVTTTSTPVTTTATPVTTTATPVTTTATPVTTTATPVSTTATPTTTTAAPAIVLTCSQSVSSGDAAVGIDMVTDISCFDGGVGCVSNVCRYCKRQSTTQSASFVSCSSIDTTLGSDITFVALPVFTTPAATTPTPTTPAPTTPTPTTPTTPTPTTPTPTTPTPTTPTPTTPAPTTPTPTTPTPTTTAPTPSPTTKAPSTTTPTPTTAICSVSSGDAAVGLSAYADTACAYGGLGCYSTTCRFCRVWTTTQSQAYYACPTASRMLSEVNEVADAPAKTSRFLRLGAIGAAGVCVAGLVALMAFAIKARLKRRARTDVVQVSGSNHQVMADAIPSSEEDDEDEEKNDAEVDSAVLSTDI